VRAQEVLIPSPSIQNCQNVRIEIGRYISTISFEKRDTLLALGCLRLKLSGGMAAEPENHKVFLNKYELIEFESDDFLSLSTFLEENIFWIEHLNPNLYVYIKQILVYPADNSEDHRFLDSELLR
jgi:hypothetical protein